MKKLCITVLFLTIVNAVTAMEPASHSLIEVFGLDKRFNDLEIGITRDIQQNVIPHGWWYPEKKLYDAYAPNIGKKVQKTAQFNPSGKKIITTILRSNVHVWDTESGALLSRCPVIGIEISSVHLNKQETNMFVIGKEGRRFCWDIQHNKLAWMVKGVPNLLEYTQLNDDVTKLIISGWCKGIVVDALTGKQEKTLWDHADQSNYRTICADFVKNTSEVVVFHNGFLQQKDGVGVHYKPLLPYNTHSPIYNREQNKLIYFYNDENEVGIVSPVIEKEKIINYVRRLGCISRYAEVSKDGTKLLLCEWSDKKKNDFKENYCFVDVYDLELGNIIITIPLDSTRQMLLSQKKNLLLIDMYSGAQLWDIYKNCLVCCFKYDAWAHSVDMNAQGDAIVIAKDDVMVWGHYKPTFKQLLLRQLLNWWWQTKRTPRKFDSPEFLLADVAKTFSLNEDKTQENPVLAQELIESWKSCASPGGHLLSAPIQAAMWQTLQKRIERSQQHKDYAPSLAL